MSDECDHVFGQWKCRLQAGHDGMHESARYTGAGAHAPIHWPPARRGRPPIEDKRRQRGLRFSDAEWSTLKAAAAAAGLSVAVYVRQRCGV